MRETFRYFEQLAVRWGDMDAMGHVNNAAYFTYCESARMGYFRALGLDELKEAECHGPAVVTATCNFHRQLHYPAELEIGARTSDVGNRSFTLEYAIYRRGATDLVAHGSSVVAWVDYSAGKAIPVPDALRRAIGRLEGGS